MKNLSLQSVLKSSSNVYIIMNTVCTECTECVDNGKKKRAILSTSFVSVWKMRFRVEKKESGEWFCATQRLRECQTRAGRYRRTSVRRTNLVLSYVLYNGFRMIIIWNMMVQCTINFVHTHAMNSTHTDNERTHTVFGGHNWINSIIISKCT